MPVPWPLERGFLGEQMCRSEICRDESRDDGRTGLLDEVKRHRLLDEPIVMLYLNEESISRNAGPEVAHGERRPRARTRRTGRTRASPDLAWVRTCVRMRTLKKPNKTQHDEKRDSLVISGNVRKQRGLPSVGWFCRCLFGRDAGIRTRDPLNPIQVRYQTAPRPDRKGAFEQGCHSKSTDDEGPAR